ncbi:MAG TPA: peptidase [Candidatus Anaerobutyricum stercoripullorum]|uniref:Peptidase n=1 Tax=Candidatus Anaerobutyricum stercoripullorum TaxID=2838456 RepID=A0A9D1X298_9FIRM|nr:peptidase [Candidatus Anaerobutyricum stercoripullorum]
MSKILEKIKQIKITRTMILGAGLCFLFALLIGRLYRLQIVDGEKYADNFVLKTKREIRQKGVRGNIYDRNGKPLARNELVYNLTMEDSQTYPGSRERQLSLNGTIYRLLKVLEQNGDTPSQYLELTWDRQGGYTFTVEGTALARFRADVFGKASIDEMSEEERRADEEDIIAYLSGEDRFCLFSQGGKEYTSEEKQQYGLPEKLSEEEVLGILHIRYALSLQAYQKYLAVTVAENVSDTSVAAILENQTEFTGVSIEEDTMRVYDGGEACASIIGYTGQISSEELDEKEEDGYAADAVVGKAGMEKYLEEDLHGKDGYREVLVDNMGRVLEETDYVRKPGTGQDVYLTIDRDLQQKVYDILEKKIADILLEHMIDARTFDKEAVSDTTEIRIPVYEAYQACFSNHLIDPEHFGEEDATELEREMLKRQKKQKKAVCQEIQETLLEQSGQEKTGKNNSGEGNHMRDYETFLMENVSLLYEEYEQDAEACRKEWEDGEITFGSYLYQVIAKGWVRDDIFEGESGYLTQEEMYESVVCHIVDELRDDSDFDLLLYEKMILEDRITPDEVILLLYAQGVLTQKDETYRTWRAGGMSAYTFFRAKIERLEITPADLALDPCSGSAVVTDTDTGEVLACVSYPGYDNNRLANEMDRDYYASLSQNASLPLYNRATQQLSAPGSTFKPVTVIAGLEEGVIEPDTAVVCDGIFDKVSPSLRCWNHAGHGKVSSASLALRHSCNDYLCEISYRLGMKGNKEFSDSQALSCLQSYAGLFHLDEKSGVELTESSPQVTDAYAIPSAIGQGTNNYATVQLGRYVNTIANKGDCYKLTLIRGIGQEEAATNVSEETAAQPESHIELSESTWNSVHRGMEMYIESTGIFKGFELPVAGKSGTAQESRLRPDHGLFIGYAPADTPEVSLAVRIVNGYTSENAVACGREILKAWSEEQPMKN